ncbi:MAG: hypothetical protein ACYDA3_14820 [Gaiellaceae bacterium]
MRRFLLLLSVTVSCAVAGAAKAADRLPTPAACLRAWNAHSPDKRFVARRKSVITGVEVKPVFEIFDVSKPRQIVCGFNFYLRPSPYRVEGVWSGGRITRWRGPFPLKYVGRAPPLEHPNARVVQHGWLTLK